MVLFIGSILKENIKSTKKTQNENMMEQWNLQVVMHIKV